MTSILLATALALSAKPAELELLSIGCSGRVDLFNSLPYGVIADLSNQVSMLQRLYETTRARVKCHCPELTDEQFKDRFSPARTVFNLIGGTVEHEEAIPCLDDEKTYTRDLHKYLSALLQGSEVTLPETCNRAAFLSEEGCSFEANVRDSLGADLRVNIAECPNSIFPAIGVWCSGDACSTLFQPCSEGSCADGQECVAGVQGIEGVFGANALDVVSSLANNFLGLNVTAAVEFMYRQIDGDIESDRTLDDCDDIFAKFNTNFFSNFAKSILGTSQTGVCLPTEWEGWGSLGSNYYGRWEKMSARPRKDECAPLKPRSDSQFNWRRGQMTDNGISGGGWCIGFNDCNFHVNAGDCESNDDFEYFMGKLYCKYKQKEGCLEYGPYCYWNRHEPGRHKCKFNHTTQDDGFTDNNWLVGLSCSNIDELADTCNAATTPSAPCEHEYCACSGGTWNKEDETCEPGDSKGKCSDMVACFGALQQCYEKMGDDSPYMQTAAQCESFFMCRCVEQANLFGCDPKVFCGRRCACMHSDKDRFIGPHCDIRLVRGTTPTLFTYDDSEEEMIPIHSWDGKLVSGQKAAKVLRNRAVPASLAVPKDSAVSEPVFVSSCDGRFWLMPKSKVGVAFQLRNLDVLAQAASEAAIASFRCAIGEDNVSPKDPVALAQLTANYFFHMPRVWYNRFFAAEEEPAIPTTFAGYLFNTSGEVEPTAPGLEAIANEAQNLLSDSSRDISGGGWVAYLLVWTWNSWGTITSTADAILKALKWVDTPTWHLPLLEIQKEVNEDERNQQIRDLIIQRQAEMLAEHQAATGVKRSGKVTPPKASGLSAEKLGLRISKDNKGPVDLYAAQCPASGLAEIQFGVGGALAGNLHLRMACQKDADCGDNGRCMPLDSYLWGAPMFEVDFMGGFLWGGNFTKGFIGGCPILSTTVNQAAFTTVKDKCHGKSLWVDELTAYWTELTGNKVAKGATPAWCHTGKDELINYVTGGVDAEAAIDLSGATVLTSRPFALADNTKKSSDSHDEL